MSSTENLRVLLLEDQEIMRQGIRTMMHMCEPRAVIQEASSYEEAIQHFEGTPADIAFLDIDLKGGKSGMDVLRFMRASGIATRAVMLSGSTDTEIVMKSIQEGASGYIPKDAKGDSIAIFRRAIDKIFSGGLFYPDDTYGKGGLQVAAGSTELEKLGVKGRRAEALYYLCQGLENKIIAYKMGVAESTVANEYNKRLFQIFKVAKRTQLVIEIGRRGIVVPTPQSALQ